MKKFIIIFLVISLSTVSLSNSTIAKSVNVEEYFKDCKPTKEIVKFLLNHYNIKHADIVLKQAILETGWLKSYHCRINNNLFGFRGNKGFYKYSNYVQSIKAYKRFQDKKYKNGEDYYKFLIRINYAEGESYNKILKKIRI